MHTDIRIIPLHSIKEIKPGDNLGEIIGNALEEQQLILKDQDIIVITQKIVSKAEGRIIDLANIMPSPFAKQIAKNHKKDAPYIEVVLQESKRIVRMDHGVIISETYHGFICANAGVDASNSGKTNSVILLPNDPDASAKRLRESFEKTTKKHLAVIISDTWGRPWREGQVNFAIGSSGIDTLIDYRGKKDTNGNELQVSLIAIADELASAAELAMGKTEGIPVALIRGYTFHTSSKDAQLLLRDTGKDMFR